jgi:hypothetical protein
VGARVSDIPLPFERRTLLTIVVVASVRTLGLTKHSIQLTHRSCREADLDAANRWSRGHSST